MPVRDSSAGLRAHALGAHRLRAVRALALWLALLLLGAIAGCADLVLDPAWYWQSARGQLAVHVGARPIVEIIDAPDVDPLLRKRLLEVQEIRRFASRVLGLPDNASYTRYTALDRPYVVWNLFATTALSMQLRQWCFPVAGCVAYRGYFDREAAEREAESLRARGLEVFVAGVPAYSTLGWFDDPVLSTFVHYPPYELARLIFHELAHQLVYLSGDATFNESFATAVEEAGMQRWLTWRDEPALTAAAQDAARRRAQFMALLQRHRARLEQLYRNAGDEAGQLAGKQRIFADLQEDYRALRDAWGGHPGYDHWFAQRTTNAHLASVAVYTDLVPVFRHLLATLDGDPLAFHARVREIARLDPRSRDQVLTGLRMAAQAAIDD